VSEQLPPPVRVVAVALHDIAWLLPRTIGAVDNEGAYRLPRAELEVMRLLVRRPGLTLTDVARELALQQSNASATIRTLIARDLVLRDRDARDRRVIRLYPTPRAQRIRRHREQIWGEELTEKLELLPKDTARRLLAAAPALRALADVLAD
jgi:DNA-binding MarR family transcriptional regulator